MIYYSSKLDGNLSQKYCEHGRSNRLEYFKKHDINVNKAICMLCHNKNIIKEVDYDDLKNFNEWGAYSIEADSIITKEDLFLYQLFGDCIPFVLEDRAQGIISLSHLGWESTHNDLHIDVIKYFIEHFDSKLADLYVYIGPSIRKESYVVKNPIQLNDEKWQPYLINIKNDLYGIDLVNYVVDGIKKMGINEIDINPIDTFVDNNMFSHYRSVKTKEEEGRFLFGVKL